MPQETLSRSIVPVVQGFSSWAIFQNHSKSLQPLFAESPPKKNDPNNKQPGWLLVIHVCFICIDCHVHQRTVPCNSSPCNSKLRSLRRCFNSWWCKVKGLENTKTAASPTCATEWVWNNGWYVLCFLFSFAIGGYNNFNVYIYK